jgi:hypothetical protein
MMLEELGNKKGPPYGGPGNVGSEWLAQATAGRLLQKEEVIAVIKESLLRG